jgi:hypothetical protein
MERLKRPPPLEGHGLATRAGADAFYVLGWEEETWQFSCLWHFELTVATSGNNPMCSMAAFGIGCHDKSLTLSLQGPAISSTPATAGKYPE